MFVFGYGRRDCPPPFNLHRHRPQKPDMRGETDAERAARLAREREEQAEARERKWQQQQEKKVRSLVGHVREMLMVIGAAGETDGSRARTRS